MTATTTPATTPATPQWLDWITRHKRETGYVLLGLTALFLVLGVYLFWKHYTNWFPEIVVCGALMLVTGLSAAWYVNRQGDGMSEEEAARVLVLGVGALLGLCIEIDSIWRTVTWWTWLTGGMEKWQTAGGWRFLYWVAMTLAGLVIIFASLSLGRKDEQASPVLRRLLYGYNTGLITLLTLLLLIVVNVLAANYVPMTSDWTKGELFTLDSGSQNTLRGLKRPVEIIVLANYPGEQLAEDTTKLIDSCRDYTSQIQFSPKNIFYKDRNGKKINELVAEFGLKYDVGMLVKTSNEEGEPKWQFFAENELRLPTGRRSQDPETGRITEETVFNGESALMTALTKLQENEPSVLYFTQGHGELTLDGSPSPRATNKSAALLKEKLGKIYTVKALSFSKEAREPNEEDKNVVGSSVPADAAVVVIAGYTPELDPIQRGTNKRAFQPHEVDALRDYVTGKDRKKPGKLLILLGPEVAAGNMAPTGLEGLLGEFGVELGNNRVLAFGVKYDPEGYFGTATIPVSVDSSGAESGDHKLTESLENATVILPELRTVDTRPGGDNKYAADTLLVAQANKRFAAGLIAFVWAETNLDLRKIDDLTSARFLDKNDQPDLQKLEAAKRDPKSRSLPIAVTVVERQAPTSPHQAADGKPKMIVIGNSVIASDAAMGSDQARYCYSIISSSLAYLREKPNLIGIEPKQRGSYKLNIDADVGTMLLQPLAFMFLGVVAFGLGIWVVRQR